MTTFTTEDRELAEKEPIPFYGFYHLNPSSPKDTAPLLHPVLKRIKVEYRADEGRGQSED